MYARTYTRTHIRTYVRRYVVCTYVRTYVRAVLILFVNSVLLNFVVFGWSGVALPSKTHFLHKSLEVVSKYIGDCRLPRKQYEPAKEEEWLFGPVRTCSDTFECIRMHSDAFGQVRNFLENSIKILVFRHFRPFSEEPCKNGRHQQLPRHFCSR